MLLFWRNGFEATSVSALTDAMGINSPSLYSAFGSKEALYVEAVRRYREIADARGLEKLDSDLSARDAVESYLMEAAAFLTAPSNEHPSGCMLTLASVSEEHPKLRDLMRSERAVALDRLTCRIKRAVDEGELPRSVDVNALARFAQTTLCGMSILARDGFGRAELESVARVAMQGWDAHVATPARPRGKARR